MVSFLSHDLTDLPTTKLVGQVRRAIAFAKARWTAGEGADADLIDLHYRQPHNRHMAIALVEELELEQLIESNRKMREALIWIRDRAIKLRKGTDDWFELVEFEGFARNALHESDLKLLTETEDEQS